jgi:hypothetical protein
MAMSPSVPARKTKHLATRMRWLAALVGIFLWLTAESLHALKPIEFEGLAQIRIWSATQEGIVCQAWATGSLFGEFFALDPRSGKKLWPLPAGEQTAPSSTVASNCFHRISNGIVERCGISDGKVHWTSVLAEIR